MTRQTMINSNFQEIPTKKNVVPSNLGMKRSLNISIFESSLECRASLLEPEILLCRTVSSVVAEILVDHSSIKTSLNINWT